MNTELDTSQILSTSHVSVSPNVQAKKLLTVFFFLKTFIMFSFKTVGDLEDSLKLPPKIFEQTFEVKAPQKEDGNLVFYCRSGNRSNTALKIAHRLGFTR